MDDQVSMMQNVESMPEAHASGRGIVVVEDQKYAVGLLWQPLQNPEDHLPEVRETLESEEGADLYCLRTTKTPQYGIGKTSLGHRDGMPSLAATVASSLGDYASYCAVFRVAEGWWFLAVRNDLILSEEDVLYPTEEEAMRAFTSMMAVPDWDLKIVPESWQIEGATQRSLEELARTGHKTRLEEINAVRKTKYLLVITLGILLLVGFAIWGIFNLWHQVFQPQKIQPIQTPEYIQAEPPTPEKPKPWEKMLKTDVFMKKCWDDVYQIKSIVIPGWSLGLITCTREGVATSWTRNSDRGLLSWIRFALEEYQFTDLLVTVSDDGSSAVGTVLFQNLPVVAAQPTWTVSQLEEDLTEIIRTTKLPLQYTQQQLLDPPNRPDGSRPANQKIYTFFSFSVASKYAPWEWYNFFSKFNSMELLKIEYNPSNQAETKWKYEGRIYAK